MVILEVEEEEEETKEGIQMDGVDGYLRKFMKINKLYKQLQIKIQKQCKEMGLVKEEINGMGMVLKGVVEGTDVIRVKAEMKLKDIKDLNKKTSDLNEKFKSIELLPRDLRKDLLSFDQKLSEINRLMTDLLSKLDLSEGASYDGTLMWKLQGVSKLINNRGGSRLGAGEVGNGMKGDSDFVSCGGENGRRSGLGNGGENEGGGDERGVIYSQPFYTSRFGYKLCGKVEFGEGEGAYVKVAVVLVEGEYDRVLGWPLERTVTLCLENHHARMMAFGKSSGGSRKSVKALDIGKDASWSKQVIWEKMVGRLEVSADKDLGVKDRNGGAINEKKSEFLEIKKKKFEHKLHPESSSAKRSASKASSGNDTFGGTLFRLVPPLLKDDSLYILICT